MLRSMGADGEGAAGGGAAGGGAVDSDGTGGGGGEGSQARNIKVTIKNIRTMYSAVMTRFPFALMLLFTTLAATGAFAQAPVIQSIVPDSGPSEGGTTVVITGKNLDVPVVCLLPCPPVVIFGDIAVDATEKSDRELTVVTPAHDVGVVDLTFVIPGRDPVVLEDGFTFVEGPESSYERVLLPIYFQGVLPGAHGAQWRSDFWIHNGGAGHVAIAPLVCPSATPCPPVFPNTLTLAAGHSLHNPTQFFAEYETNLSQILYVSKDGAKDVSMSLRVADTSRNALNGGTDLPVIRESELLTRNSQLFNVPFLNQNFRVLLRIYDVTHSDALYSVLLYPAGEGVSDAIYAVTLNAVTPRAAPFRDEAAYVEFDVTALLQLRRVWPESLRIEIRPKMGGSRYWAFASATNNDTQLVTLITPQ